MTYFEEVLDIEFRALETTEQLSSLNKSNFTFYLEEWLFSTILVVLASPKKAWFHALKLRLFHRYTECYLVLVFISSLVRSFSLVAVRTKERLESVEINQHSAIIRIGF